MTTSYVGPNGQWVSVADTPNQGKGSGSGDYTQLTTNGVIKGTPGTLVGFEVVVALGAGAVTVYDNASAASGNILCVIPASSGVGTRAQLNVKASAGLYAAFASTGTVNFIWN